jgi:hypothetical protein
MSTFIAPPFKIPQTFYDDLKKLGPLVDLGKQIKSLGDNIDARMPGKPFTNFQLVVRIIFRKGFQTYLSTQNLCRCGCGSDALSLCGSLFENWINLKYIVQDADSLSTQYIQYNVLGKYYRAVRVEGQIPESMKPQFNSNRAELEKRMNELRADFKEKGYGWSKKSLYSRAIAVGAESEYAGDYWVFCGHKHTEPTALDDFVGGVGGGMDIILGPSMKNIYHATFWSTAYFLRLCEEVQHIHDLPCRADIDKIQNGFMAIVKQVQDNHPELCY